MARFGLQLSVISILTTALCLWHQLSKIIVHEGFGLIAIAIILLSTPILSRYLD